MCLLVRECERGRGEGAERARAHSFASDDNSLLGTLRSNILGSAVCVSPSLNCRLSIGGEPPLGIGIREGAGAAPGDGCLLSL